MTTTTHRLHLDATSSLVVATWTCTCGHTGTARKSGRDARALRGRLLALAEQHLDDSGADLADFDALAAL